MKDWRKRQQESTESLNKRKEIIAEQLKAQQEESNDKKDAKMTLAFKYGGQPAYPLIREHYDTEKSIELISLWYLYQIERDKLLKRAKVDETINENLELLRKINIEPENQRLEVPNPIARAMFKKLSRMVLSQPVTDKRVAKIGKCEKCGTVVAKVL